MTPVIIAHAISINLDLGKSIKSIMDIIRTKLGVDITTIDNSVDTSSVNEELNDFNTLVNTRSLENKVKYNYKGNSLTFMELLGLIGKDIFSSKPGVLEEGLEIEGMEPSAYIELVTQCRAISEKYVH